MKASIFTLLLVLGPASGKDFCEEKLRTSVQDAVLLKNGTLLTRENDAYPAGTFWKDEAEGHWWVCPCLLGNCIRICDKEFAEEVIENSSGFDLVTHFLWNEITETDTPPIEFFKQIRHAKCDGVSNILIKEDVRILASGEMRLENKRKLYGAEDYCVHQMEGKNSIHLMLCLADLEVNFEEEASPLSSMEIFYIIYRLVLLLSAIFLVLTVVAYTLSPQIESFHRKSVIFYAAYYAVGFFAVTVSTSYFSGKILVKEQCFLIGYIVFYLHLSLVFWLNSMCIDIFSAYKGVLRTGSNYFAKFVAYSTGLPILIVAAALYFNRINDEYSIFNPKMGDGLCWINGKEATWIYYYVPNLILLLANLGLLFATCERGNPVRTTERTNQTVPREKERRRTYLILTLLAGYTFIIEVIPNIYYFTIIMSLFGASQGVLIFLLLVCADKYVRKSLSSRFFKGQPAQII
ncbi:probable G-protein coupled receptor Mth-like 6 [Cloeon dipterum]|uniref:probable G-protein coupled receptor Mth-like 6 n=1 Tax=Cloeon dipterum TaxID=197152 RepID=UPI00321FAC16